MTMTMVSCTNRTFSLHCAYINHPISVCGVIVGGLYDGVPADVFSKGTYPKMEAIASQIVNLEGVKVSFLLFPLRLLLL
jgi:hypothetical protein